MSSQRESAKVKVELKKLKSAAERCDSGIRDVIKLRIKECRVKLRKLQAALR